MQQRLLTKSEFRIKITGRPASKKNSRVNLPDGRSFPSKAYRQFLKDALYQLMTLRKIFHEPIATPVRIEYTFYQKGKLTQDGDNAMASINDVLQEAGIIADDKLIKQWSGDIVEGANDWSTEIHLEW